MSRFLSRSRTMSPASSAVAAMIRSGMEGRGAGTAVGPQVLAGPG